MPKAGWSVWTRCPPDASKARPGNRIGVVSSRPPAWTPRDSLRRHRRPSWPVNADSRMAWIGTYEEGRPDTSRVEAAALAGRPVFFRVLGPWQEPESVATPAAPAIRQYLPGGRAGHTARRRGAGRVAKRAPGTRRTKSRLACRRHGVRRQCGQLGTGGLSCPDALGAVPARAGPELGGIPGGLLGFLYLAVEPFVRKHWPDALISWLRVVGGRLRDPLVASHVLVGVRRGWWFRCSMRRVLGDQRHQEFWSHRREHERERRAISLRQPPDGLNLLRTPPSATFWFWSCCEAW